MKTGIVVIVALCALLMPAQSISRWFTSSYYDLRVTLRRYARCEGSLAPLKKQGSNDTEYFIDQIRLFLDQANYDNEQLANITQLMGTICRDNDNDVDYAISVHIDVNRYNSSSAKAKTARCKGIDRAMDAMFGVFKRAALNKSEPLDFSLIQFPSDFESSLKDSYYNLTDLINTLWISSETPLDQTCGITKSVMDYVKLRTSNSTAQDRSQVVASPPNGYLGSLLELINRMLDPVLGLQKRFYWEGSNRVEVLYIMVGNQLGYLRDGLGRGYKSTRDRLSNVFSYALTTGSNSTLNSGMGSLNLTTFGPFNLTTISGPLSNLTTTRSPSGSAMPESVTNATPSVSSESLPLNNKTVVAQ